MTVDHKTIRQLNVKKHVLVCEVRQDALLPRRNGSVPELGAT